MISIMGGGWVYDSEGETRETILHACARGTKNESLFEP